MALLPYGLRPSVIIRRKAIWGGLLGQSTFWKVVAAWVFGKGTIKKFFGKSPEVITKQKVGFNSFVNVINAKPLPKKQTSALGITKQVLKARASEDVARSWAVKAEKKPSRKNLRRAVKTSTMAAEAQAKAAKHANTRSARRKAAKAAARSTRRADQQAS